MNDRAIQLDAYLAPAAVGWFRERLLAWASKNFRDFPWRHTRDPYAILIAEFLLQKTGANTALPVYKAFLARYPAIADVAAASPAELAALLQPLGLAFRAERLHRAARILCDRHGGRIPANEADLLALPGIGPYAARSICAHAFGLPRAVLDTNVARIVERFFGLRGDRVKSRCKLLWAAADRLLPVERASYWNLTLLDFGALVCTARHPRCLACPLAARCAFLHAMPHPLPQGDRPHRPPTAPIAAAGDRAYRTERQETVE